MELAAVQRYNDAIGLARERGDNGTRELLERHLTSEEESVDWLESQLHLDDKLGTKNYLAEQMGGDDD